MITRIHARFPNRLKELVTFWRKRSAILLYFDTGTSNGPIERIYGRLGICAGSPWD